MDQIPRNEISIYKGKPLSPDCIVKNTATIKKAFPVLPIGFYDVLTLRLKANNFTNERLTDAVNHVIDTCRYPTPTIAEFISFDRRFKYYTYEQMINICRDMGTTAWEKYKILKFPELETKVWVHVNDIKQYNLQSYDSTPKP